METYGLTMGMKRKPVLRGGSWNNNDNNCRVANRNNNNPENRNNNNGFRVSNAINRLLQPELAGGTSTRHATKIAQFCVRVQLHRMIIYRLVGRESRKPILLQSNYLIWGEQ
jgi:hypothetical protein